MIGDLISPAQRLSRLSANRWEHRLSLLFFVIALLLTLALMCENVNAAPQDSVSVRTEVCCSATENVSSALTDNALKPVGAAPFTLSHPLCSTGFMLAQRFDTRDRFDWIVKRQWTVTGCAKGRIVYGGKV